MTDPSARPDGAPVLADETPSVNGLASGLLRMVCISAPARPSEKPTTTAIRATKGSQFISQKMFTSRTPVAAPAKNFN